MPQRMPVTTVLSMALRMPPPPVKPTIAPHARPNAAQPTASPPEKPRLPFVGSMTRRRPCSSASMNSSTFGAVGAGCFAETTPESALAGSTPENRRSSMLRAAAVVWVASDGDTSADARGAASVRFAASPYKPTDSVDDTAATLALVGVKEVADDRTRSGSAAWTNATIVEEFAGIARPMRSNSSFDAKCS